MKCAQLPLQKTVHLATAKPKPFSQGPLKGRRFLGDKMTTKHNHVADSGGKGKPQIRQNFPVYCFCCVHNPVFDAVSGIQKDTMLQHFVYITALCHTTAY